MTILNVFSRSLYAPYSDAEFVHENDRLSYVSAMRRREDERFVQQMVHELPKAAKANLQMVDLNLKDAPLRLRCALEDVAIWRSILRIRLLGSSGRRSISGSRLEMWRRWCCRWGWASMSII